MIVAMCAQQATVADVATYMLAKKLGPMKQVRAYVLQVAFTTGGTDYNARYTFQVISRHPEIFPDTIDPFVLGGMRKGGVREVDKDCSEVEKDPIYPKMWLGPLGCATVDS